MKRQTARFGFSDRVSRQLLVLSAISPPLVAFAQQTEAIRKIGVLIDGWAPHPLPDALRKELAARGYVVDRQITFDVRYAEGSPERAAELAADLVAGGANIIVAHFTPAVRAAMAATKTIPIIMAPAGAPVQTGLVGSLSRPGGNVTVVTKHGCRTRRPAAAVVEGLDTGSATRRRSCLVAGCLHPPVPELHADRSGKRRPAA